MNIVSWYWKDATQLYIAQIDKMIARGGEVKLNENRHYGGAIYKKVSALLSLHDIKGAVAAFSEAKLFKEAYILCRIRYMDSIAEEILREWAKNSSSNGNNRIAAICYMALGNISDAATVLAKSRNQECLSLAADLAKISGRATFADHVEKKALTTTYRPRKESTEELLEDLPSRIELLMKDVKDRDQNENEGIQNENEEDQNENEEVQNKKDVPNGDEKGIQNVDSVQVGGDGDK